MKLQNLNFEQIKEELEKLKDCEDKVNYMFKNSEVVLIYLTDLIGDSTVTFRDLVNLFRYAIKEMGISGNIITKILMKFLILKKDNKNI